VFGLTFVREGECVEKYAKCHFGDEPGNEVVGFELSLIESIEGVKNMPDFLMVAKLKDQELRRKVKAAKRKKKKEAQLKSGGMGLKKQTKELSEDDEGSSDSDAEELEHAKDQEKGQTALKEKQ
jgi:hypothetical protein